MTTEIVPVDDRERIAMMVEAVGAMEVTDQTSNLAAAEVLRDVKGLRERIAARVTDLRRPILAQANAISKAAKPFLADLDDAEKHLKGITGSWMKEQRDIARAEEQARQDALQRAVAEGRHEDADAALEALLVPVEQPWRPPGVSLHTTWRAEVTDFRAYVAWAAGREPAPPVRNGKEPREWLLPNIGLLNDYAREVRGESSIPGVRFVSTTGVAASGR